MAAYKPTPDDKKMRAECDLMTLIEAEKIKKDTARMKAALQCKKEKMAAMESISKQGDK